MNKSTLAIAGITIAVALQSLPNQANAASFGDPANNGSAAEAGPPPQAISNFFKAIGDGASSLKDKVVNVGEPGGYVPPKEGKVASSTPAPDFKTPSKEDASAWTQLRTKVSKAIAPK